MGDDGESGMGAELRPDRYYLLGDAGSFFFEPAGDNEGFESPEAAAEWARTQTIWPDLAEDLRDGVAAVVLGAEWNANQAAQAAAEAAGFPEGWLERLPRVRNFAGVGGCRADSRRRCGTTPGRTGARDRARACDVVGRIGQAPRVIEPAPQGGPEAGSCPSCGRHPTWESLVDADGERWLAVCRCGRMQAYLPELPGLEPEDPLRTFLVGPGRPIFPASPPWVRVLASFERPDPVRWRFCHAPCRACGASASFGMQACPRAGVFAICTLCLACGHATACYSKPGRAVFEGRSSGGRGRRPASRCSACATASTAPTRCCAWTAGASATPASPQERYDDSRRRARYVAEVVAAAGLVPASVLTAR